MMLRPTPTMMVSAVLCCPVLASCKFLLFLPLDYTDDDLLDFTIPSSTW